MLRKINRFAPAAACARTVPARLPFQNQELACDLRFTVCRVPRQENRMRHSLAPQDVAALVHGFFHDRTPSEHTLYLLVVDCETFRFTLEGPMAPERVAVWDRETGRAIAAGRSICCISIAGAEPREILALGAELECEAWPPNTIIAPLDTVETPLYLKRHPPVRQDSAARKR
jgi:hypothetical protein